MAGIFAVVCGLFTNFPNFHAKLRKTIHVPQCSHRYALPYSCPFLTPPVLFFSLFCLFCACFTADPRSGLVTLELFAKMLKWFAPLNLHLLDKVCVVWCVVCVVVGAVHVLLSQ